jgi:DNA-binding NtrC family response regulator
LEAPALSRQDAGSLRTAFRIRSMQSVLTTSVPTEKNAHAFRRATAHAVNPTTRQQPMDPSAHEPTPGDGRPRTSPARTHTGLAARIHALAAKRWGAGALPILVGLHPSFANALERLACFAQGSNPVLLTGETGTGKELFARSLYLLSDRNGRPFLRVNCAQYHEGQLLASELFGHKKGSFTGAVADHVGLLEAADGGVVLLDEVAELSPSAQAMLLRALGEGEIVPVGETRPRRVEVRLVAAAGCDLRAMVRGGRFREDLYYRLSGFRLHVPALRERGQDWLLLRDHYLDELGLACGRPKAFSREATAILGGYCWPGNVRELKSLVSTAFYLSEGGSIEPRHFLESLEEAASEGQLAKVPFSDAGTSCYESMLTQKASFWDVVHGPYMDRELSRPQVRTILLRGLETTRGSYKKLLPLFGIAEGDYLRFMDFLRHHRLKPEGD